VFFGSGVFWQSVHGALMGMMGMMDDDCICEYRKQSYKICVLLPASTLMDTAGGLQL